MDFISLKKKYHQDTDYPPRTFELMMYRRVLEGTIYDILPNDFSTNSYNFFNNDNVLEEGEIPIYERRPSVRDCISKQVVDDSVALLFGEERFPKIIIDDENTTQKIAKLVSSSNLVKEMNSAAHDGSVGSAAVLFKIIKGKVYFESVLTEYLLPFYSLEEPNKLIKVKQKYKVSGYELPFLGYDETTVQLTETYWIVREWTRMQEIVYKPFLVSKEPVLIIDTERSVEHNLGFVPIYWIKNLSSSNCNAIDGKCTFKDAIDTNITLDYILSQGGRGLNYSLEPLLVIADSAFTQNSEIVMGGGNVLRVSEKGKANHAEISGDATRAVLDYAEKLRKIALQNIHGNRSDPDKMSFAQSAKAMEILHLTLIWLASQMRITYGEEALRAIIKMVIESNQIYELIIDDEIIPIGTLKCGEIKLKWAQWFSETIDDKQKRASTIKTLKDAGIISSKTATTEVAEEYKIKDVDQELVQIELDNQKFLRENPKIQETIQG